MTAPVIDQSIPLDLFGCETRERHGCTEAVCPGCGAWVRLNYYKADRMVIRAIAHIPRCHYYENLFK